jgi:polar amino acid transport system substrate-binding protein
MAGTRHRHFWKIAAMWLIAIGTASIVLSAQAEPLRLVSTAWSPFTNEAGLPRFATDLVDAALDRVGMKTTTTIVDPMAFTPELLGGHYDGSAAAWKDNQRSLVLAFSDPYLENRLILIGRKGADVSAKTLRALIGKRVAIVGGYSYGAIEGTGPSFIRSQGEEDSLTLLLQSQVDYALMDELVVQYLLDNYAKNAQERLALGSTPLVTRPLYFVIRRSRPDADSIINRFNAQLRGMIADRTYHKLLHVAWLRADINGDGIAEYIPASDQVGTAPPDHVYTLISTPTSSKPTESKRFYVGGNIYNDWAAVPDRYKIYKADEPDPRRSTASIFTFTW